MISGSFYALYKRWLLSAPPSSGSRVWAGVEGKLKPVVTGPRLQTPKAGGNAVFVFVLHLVPLEQRQGHELLAPTCLASNAFVKLNVREFQSEAAWSSIQRPCLPAL